jgi:nicotinamide-nucleotide amidase
MRAQILSIGSELILGHLTDTNATFLAQQLAGLGIELTHVTQVGDDLELLSAAIERAMAVADVLICTGGVGPTADDLTREAIATVMGEEPTIQPELLEELRAFFRARGIEMPERNAKQAWLIPSAEALPNPVGTAPGWFARRDGHAVAAMPGVPREMFRMWQDQVVPRLLTMLDGRCVRTVTIKTIGIGESAAEQLLTDLVARPNPVVATYAKDDGVHIRVTASALDEANAMQLRDETAGEVSRRLAQHIYSADDRSLPGALLDLSRIHGVHVSIVDHGGGDRFAAMLLTEPDADDVLISAAITARADARNAQALAESALIQPGTNLGVGIRVDVAQRAESVFEGTVEVAVAGIRQAIDRSPARSGYEDIQRRSALFAADVLRRALLTPDSI